MSEQRQSKYPYQPLGERIKQYREKLRESAAEVSGAVEIEPEALQKIEQGAERPSEDILMLLISHFEIKDEEAVKLWELAGYTQAVKAKGDQPMTPDDIRNQQMFMIMPMDNRVVYTDTVQVSVNNYGVVMNFMQNNGSSSQPQAISRIGMSKEHAKSVIELLQQSLHQAEIAQRPKSLPAPKTNKDTDKK